MAPASPALLNASPAAAHRGMGPGGGEAQQALARGLKHELKAWEAEFQAAHGRSPTKDDLLQLPDIARKYREYSRLKRSACSGQRPRAPPPPPPDSRPADGPASHVMLSLETSVLAMSLKRKTPAGCGAAPRARPPSALASTTTKDGKAAEAGDGPEKVPKRQRTRGAATSRSTSTATQADPAPASDPAPGLVPELPRVPDPMLTGGSPAGAAGSQCEAVAYTPPPSLIRRYGQRTPSASAQSRLLSFPSASAQTLGALGDAPAEPPVCALPFEARARAGRLVKTTSIPLSAFGAGSHGGSGLASALGHLSDGNEDSQSGAPAMGGLADLDDGDLVVGDDAPAGPSGAGAAEPRQPKKATQKRSTRRVRLRPVDESECAGPSVRAADSQHLVSSNFYKLKLKSRRRGAQSAEERRSALYKRMVAKKQRAGGSAAAPGRGAQEEPGPDACDGGGTGADTDAEAGVDGYSSGTGDPGPESPAGGPGPLGQPLSCFAADEEARRAGATCTVELGHGPAARSSVELDLRRILQHIWALDQFRPGQVEAIRRVVRGQSTLVSLATGSGKSLVYQLASVVLAGASGGLTLVVMPLLSLMRDQVRQLPPGLQAVCMSSESSGQDVYSKAARQLASGQVHLLFVSPERLQSPRFQAMMAAKGMPRVRLAVVDEAHCADEWSHNFRPAYLQLPQLLQRLGAACVLAMTGTATAALADRLCRMFAIDAAHGVVRGCVLRRNIALSVVPVDIGAEPQARSTAREDALVRILKLPDMATLDSVIVYVSTQATANRVAEYLTVRSIPAQSYHAGKPAAERARIQAAFMRTPPPGDASGGSVPIRVLVATVAFGMGLNKSDVRAVIHFNLPRGMEAYVQEIGRAGRDGAPARGILILATFQRTAPPSAPLAHSLASCASADAVLLRSWAHVAGADRSSVRRLLQRLFPPSFILAAVAAATQARTRGVPCGSPDWRISHTAVLEHQRLEADVDSDQSTARTLISYLALAEPGMFHVEPDSHRRCAVRFTRTDPAALASAHRLFAAIVDTAAGGEAPIVARRRRGIVHNMPGGRRPALPADATTVDVFELAKRMSTEPSDVVAELYQWRAKREVVLEWLDPSHVVKVTLDTGRFAGPGDPVAPGGDDDADDDADRWGEQLARRIDDHIVGLAEAASQQNMARVHDSLQRIHAAEATMLAACRVARRIEQLQPASEPAPTVEPSRAAQNDLLHAAIEAYFAPTQADREQAVRELSERMAALCEGALDGAALACLLGQTAPAAGSDAEATKSEIRPQVAAFVQQHSSQLTSARVVARVFHGLPGPNCTSSQWMWCPEWGRLVATDFDVVQQCANEELVRLRCGAAASHPE